MNIPAHVWQVLVDEAAPAAAVLDGAGQFLFRSRQFPALSQADQAHLQQALAAEQSALELTDSNGLTWHFRLQRIGDFRLLLVPGSQQRDAAIDLFLSLLQAGGDVFAAAAQALGRALGWRWVGVSRFVEAGDSVQVLAWWDTDHLAETFQYSLYGTPCEQVVARDGFCAFSNVQSAFDEEALREMGAQIYAGMVYRGRDGQALGHLFALHDQGDVDPAQAEAVLQLMAQVVGSQLVLLDTEEAMARTSRQAHSDGLTGLGNRLAFDRAVGDLAESYEQGRFADALVLMIDLDGMKAINDHRGHAAGDALLIAFSKLLPHLGRSGEQAFRLGGDEFAMLMPGADLALGPLLQSRVVRVVDEMRCGGFPEMGMSLGWASLVEAQGQVRSALALADQRMYADKRGKRSRR